MHPCPDASDSQRYPSSLVVAAAHARRWAGAPRVLSAADVGGDPAFQVLLAEGLLREVWNAFAFAADVPLTPTARAGALMASLPPAGRRCVLGRSTAVWVYTGRHRPRRAELLVARGVRVPPPDPGYVAHESRIGDGETVRLGTIHVTDVCRTAADVARWSPLDSAAPLLASLADLPEFDVARATAMLRPLRRYRGVHQALSLLASMATEQSQYGSGRIAAAREPVIR